MRYLLSPGLLILHILVIVVILLFHTFLRTLFPNGSRLRGRFYTKFLLQTCTQPVSRGSGTTVQLNAVDQVPAAWPSRVQPPIETQDRMLWIRPSGPGLRKFSSFAESNTMSVPLQPSYLTSIWRICLRSAIRCFRGIGTARCRQTRGITREQAAYTNCAHTNNLWARVHHRKTL